MNKMSYFRSTIKNSAQDLAIRQLKKIECRLEEIGLERAELDAIRDIYQELLNMPRAVESSTDSEEESK